MLDWWLETLLSVVIVCIYQVNVLAHKENTSKPQRKSLWKHQTSNVWMQICQNIVIHQIKPYCSQVWQSRQFLITTRCHQNPMRISLCAFTVKHKQAAAEFWMPVMKLHGVSVIERHRKNTETCMKRFFSSTWCLLPRCRGLCHSVAGYVYTPMVQALPWVLGKTAEAVTSLTLVGFTRCHRCLKFKPRDRLMICDSVVFTFLHRLF